MIKTKNGLDARNIAHRIELESSGDSVDAMNAAEKEEGVEVLQDWENGTTTWTFTDGSALAADGYGTETSGPTIDVADISK
jgi:hypothetical protein